MTTERPWLAAYPEGVPTDVDPSRYTSLVALMEQAAIDAIRPCLLPGEGSVGTKIEMSHLAATPVGMVVTAKAELVEVTGKKMVFSVTATDSREVVGTCRHERFLVGDMAAFLAKVAAKRQISC